MYFNSLARRYAVVSSALGMVRYFKGETRALASTMETDTV